MIINAAAAIENNKQEINDLNVFPVPDGDTGTNMSLTIGAAERALLGISPLTVGEAADATAAAMLRGARGNSGVILSLLFRGLSRRLKDIEAADCIDFATALIWGVESAYKAVMKPAEGTILTVSRLAAGAAVLAAEQELDVETMLEQAIEEGDIALADTVNLNPVLKKAGVVDAGAKGYMYILEGMLKAVRGEELTKAKGEAEPVEKADFSSFSPADIEFTYCTEFIIEKKSRTAADNLQDFLNSMGDCVVVVDDDDIIKVHVHTNDPGVVLTEALTYGALLSIKIENMLEQHSESIVVGDQLASQIEDREECEECLEMKDFGFVAVCAGTGIEAVFCDLGTDGLITGGQTMNPSTEDILEKIAQTPSDVVFVLPNNKNIIMAAEQCIPLSEKRIIVIPTRTIAQGVAAMLAADGLSDIGEMEESMKAAASKVETALITLAARDSVFDDIDIKEGEYIALLDDVLIANGRDFYALLDTLVEKLRQSSPEFITVYAGEDVAEDDAHSVAARLGGCFPNADTTLIMGCQPVYHYIIAAE